MGKFSDAFAKGRKSAKEEKEKKSHQGNADTARRLAGVAAALGWTERVVYPAVQSANADLEKDGLVVKCDGGTTDVGAEVTLTVSKIGTPRLTLFGQSKQPMLTEIGRDLGSVQAAPAARPEMAGMIALAVLRSLAARQVFD